MRKIVYFIYNLVLWMLVSMKREMLNGPDKLFGKYGRLLTYQVIKVINAVVTQLVLVRRSRRLIQAFNLGYVTLISGPCQYDCKSIRYDET